MSRRARFTGIGMVVAMVMALLSATGGRAQEAGSAVVYTVSYIEVLPSARPAAVSALKQYRDLSGKETGFIRMELFEQADRAGHYVVIESWGDAKASDAHATAAHTKQLLNGLQPVRLSDYDQRPYKNLFLGPAAAGTNAQTLFVITHVDVGGPAGAIPPMLQRLAEASRKEDGNLRFDVLAHTMKANHFTVIEAWKDAARLDAHAAAAHTRQYRDALQSALGSPLDERLYRAVN